MRRMKLMALNREPSFSAFVERALRGVVETSDRESAHDVTH